MTGLPPIDTPEQATTLRTSNRRVLAERLNWPAGHLEACEKFDAEHPGWHANWHRANVARPPWGHPAGFVAVMGSVWVYGETIEALAAQLVPAEAAAAEKAEAQRRASW